MRCLLAMMVHVNTTNNKIERDPPRSNNLLNTSTPNTTIVLDVNTMLRAEKQYRSGLRLHTFQWRSNTCSRFVSARGLRNDFTTLIWGNGPYQECCVSVVYKTVGVIHRKHLDLRFFVEYGCVVCIENKILRCVYYYALLLLSIHNPSVYHVWCVAVKNSAWC